MPAIGYVLFVASPYDKHLAGVFLSQEEALVYFHEHYDDTYDYNLIAYEVDPAKIMGEPK